MSLRSPLWLLLTLAACQTGAPVKGPRPGELGGYPPQATRGGVHVEARYYLDQAAIFGGDMVADLSMVPVALRLGVVGGGEDSLEVAASPEDMDLALLLPDGTSLRRVPLEALDVRRRRFARLVQESLTGGFLPAWTEPREGFVYFELPPGVRVDSSDLEVRRQVSGGVRRMRLSDAVVSFTLSIDGESREINVGLQPDRSSQSRLSVRGAQLQ